MDCEVLAIGSELLMGQVVDTNSSWMGERLAAAGIACFYQGKVGDNHDRIVAALRVALGRADAVICCGGLGPTQDDITREAIAEVMGVPLARDPEIVVALKERFRGRDVPDTNYKQADVPVGALTIKPVIGSAARAHLPGEGAGGGQGGLRRPRGPGRDARDGGGYHRARPGAPVRRGGHDP